MGVPARIGRYAVEREIGRGGMGRVFLARDPELDRRIAIKVLPDDSSPTFSAAPERSALAGDPAQRCA